MGLFQKTITDIYDKSQEGKFIEAEKILKQHIEAEHHFQSDLSGLQGALNAYSHELRELEEESGYLIRAQITRGKKTPASEEGLKQLFKTKTYNARIQLTKIEALIMRLRKDAKLELK